ncbi:hypothetical protein [Streptococcus sobrinus]|uniref:hypothetical protein n=1 Tax=Streptococcus sobrinus TaxID=1310 RepID=UPI0002FCC7B5|nr:hypothetical protein [Streptococcus sobrinus]
MNTIAFEKFETVDANSLMAVEGGWFWDNWKGGELPQDSTTDTIHTDKEYRR